MEFWNPIIGNILGAVLSALALAAVGALLQFARKKGIEISAEQQARLEHFARQAALKVEEIAKGKMQGDLKGTRKLEMAVADVIDITGVSADVARNAVLAALPPLPGVGAVGKPVPEPKG